VCEASKRLRTWVEGVACACAVTGRVLLDAAGRPPLRPRSELDDMEGIEDAGGVLELIVDGVLISLEEIHRRLNHRNLAGTPAQGASITSTTTRPWPCAIQPATRAPRQLVARLNIKHQGPWGASHAHQMEALQTDEQITPIKRHTAAAGKARHRPRSLKTARVEVRSSPGTSTSTRNSRSTPTHPHSTRKSR